MCWHHNQIQYIYIYIYIYDISSLRVNDLTLILLTWRKWWTPNNASKWQMGFNSGFKGVSSCWIWQEMMIMIFFTSEYEAQLGVLIYIFIWKTRDFGSFSPHSLRQCHHLLAVSRSMWLFFLKYNNINSILCQNFRL